MNLTIVCGARPNFIKVAPIIRDIDHGMAKDINYTLVYTGREDDPTLEGSLFDDLQISRPDIFLGADAENLNELTGEVMSKFENYLQSHHTDAVVVVDDLASTMAVAIVTKKQGILLAHIAAGTRSFDITMPKEINRLVIDGLSDILFTAGISNNSIANREGAELSKVYMVGNILIDNLRDDHERIEKAEMPDDVKALTEGQYIVFTINRKVLLGDKKNLGELLAAVNLSAGDIPVIAPLRDLAVGKVNELKAEGLDLGHIHIVSPLSYLAFSRLTAHAIGVITDSGNVAEEATFNQVPCATLNSYTEHIETVKTGTNILVGEDAQTLAKAVEDMVRHNWKSSRIPDRWDGRTAERILQILENNHNSH